MGQCCVLHLFLHLCVVDLDSSSGIQYAFQVCSLTTQEAILWLIDRRQADWLHRLWVCPMVYLLTPALNFRSKGFAPALSVQRIVRFHRRF